MHRTGVRPSTAPDLIRDLKDSGCFDIVGVYSHLATADVPDDPFAQHQIEIFKQLATQLRSDHCLWHLANSGGTVFYPDSHFDMVRPGLLCYGYFPDGRKDPEGEIAPCFSLKSRISYFKVVPQGAGISYGHAYKTLQESRIVTVPVGYGDGYRRAFSNQAFVLIGGKRYRLSGTICMDQFMVDIGKDTAFVGDEVVLIGKQGREEISIEELTKVGDMITYELLCGFNERLPRIYIY
jgi:alanine racemase